MERENSSSDQAVTEGSAPSDPLRADPTRASVWREACACGLRCMLRRAVIALVVFVGFGVGLVYISKERSIEVPDWARQKIEAKLESELGELSIEFGALRLILNEGLRPRVALRDVVLRYPDGQAAAQLNDAAAAISLSGLFYGRLQPKDIYLGGLLATLRQDGEQMALSLADGGTAVRQAQNLPDLIEQWDAYFDLPVLSALRSVEVEAISLRYEDLRINRAWTLDGGYLRMDRIRDDLALSVGFSVLGGGDSVGAVEANYTSAIGDTAAEFGISFTDLASEDIAVQSPALGWLNVLRAPISGSVRGSLDSEGGLNPVAANLDVGRGALQPDQQARPVIFDGASSYFTYYPAEQILQFDTLQVSSDLGSGQMEGVARLSGIENGQLTDLVGQLRFSDLSLNPLKLYEEEQSFPGVTTDFKLELNPFRFRLGEATVTHRQSTAHLSGEIWTGPEGWAYALDGTVDYATMDQVKELWPVTAPPKARKWVRDNILAGIGRDAQISLRSQGKKPPFVSLSLGFQGLEVRYQKLMPHLEGAQGQFSIHGNRLVASLGAGHVVPPDGGMLDAAGTSFIIPDLSVKGGSPAVVRIAAKGSVTGALSMLNQPPLEVLKNTGLSHDLSAGRVEAVGTLALALKDKLPISEVEYHYSGTVYDVETDALVPDHVLTAQELRLSGDNRYVSLEGNAALSGVPTRARWYLPLAGAEGYHHVAGRVELSPEALNTFNVGLPRGMVRGKGEAEFEVTLPKDSLPQLTLRSDLQGVRLAIPALDWGKSAGARGDLRLRVSLGNRPTVEELELNTAGLAARGRVTLRDGGGLDQANFSQLSIGNWLSGSATLVGRGAAAPALRVTSGRLDLRRAPFGSSSSGSGGGSGRGSGGIGPIEFALNQIQVTDSIALSNARGRVSTSGGINGQFRGRLNGQTPISGVLVPQAAGMAMRIQAEDAGGVFRSSGVLRHAAGGRFDMTLQPTGRAGYFRGRVVAENVRIQRAPAMLALVNALSLVGLVTELTGNGLLFTQVEADFELAPTHIKVLKSSAVGPSIGLSMDGVYDLKTSRLNMRGVLSPLYVVNVVGSVLTRKGEGLIGFSFNLRGTADDPDVSVNPLSGLAPGFLREIFRREAPLAPGEVRAPRKSLQQRREEREER